MRTPELPKSIHNFTKSSIFRPFIGSIAFFILLIHLYYGYNIYYKHISPGEQKLGISVVWESNSTTTKLNLAPSTTPTPTPTHPIEALILDAFAEYEHFTERQSKTADEAIAAYKARYNRGPPARYKEWAEYAISQKSVVIDDYDVIEHSIAPFRQATARQLKERIKSAGRHGGRMQYMQIANGISSKLNIPLLDSLKPVFNKLPNVVFLLNELDEARVIGNEPSPEKDEVYFRIYGKKDNWEHAIMNCDPQPSVETLPPPPHYVNSTADMLNVCINPTYRYQYGFFTSPATFTATHQLVPIFSVSKISTLRDIIYPGHDYHADRFLNSNDTDNRTFVSKEDKLYWRGSNTGTHATKDTWQTNHRVRFMQRVKNQTDLFDVGMTAYIQCDWSACVDMELALGKPPRAGHDLAYNYKFLMDMDGNGFSGRFYRLLSSNSVVFKQTLMQQWHDDRIFPWVHYVPVSIGLDEIEDLMEFFTKNSRGRELAEKIAEESTKWVKAALREEDMRIYEYRLMLEYAELFREKP